MQTPEETAQTLIANAGFLDSRVIPTNVVKGLLIEALSGANLSEQRTAEILEAFQAPQVSSIVVERQPQRVLRRLVDVGLSKRISRLEAELDAVMQ